MDSFFYVKNKDENKYYFFINNFCLFSYSLVMLLIIPIIFLLKNGISIANNITTIVALIGLISFVMTKRESYIPNKRITIFFILYAAIIVFNKLLHGDSIDISRTIIVVTIFFIFLPKKSTVLISFIIGCSLAGIGIGVLSIYEYSNTNMRVSGYTNAILLSQAALTLAIFNFVILAAIKNKLLQASLIFSITLSLISLYLSQSRGVWLAFAIILLLFLITNIMVRPKKFIPITIVSILLISFLVGNENTISKRIHQGMFDLKQISAENYNTSWGLRVIAWKSAWFAFVDHPITGVGHDNFNRVKAQQYDNEIMDEIIVKRNLYHAHNQYLQNMMTRGIIGLTGLIAILLIPLIIFKKNSDRIKYAYFIPLSFMIYGITDVPLEHKNILYIYVFMIYLISILINLDLNKLRFGDKND